MICFFCLESRPSNLEHIFPKAIGGTLTTNRVCKPCNDQLGHEVDVLVTDHIFIQFRRSDLSLAGQSGKIPNSTEALLGRSVIADDPKQRVRLVTNRATGRLEPRILPKRISKVLDDGTRKEGMVVDASTPSNEIRRIILRVYKRENLLPPVDQELDRIITQIRSSIVTVEQPEVKARVQVDIADYKRGLLKIAYELACTWLGDNYLEDPLAAAIRDVVLGRVSYKKARVRGTADMVRPDALCFWPANQDTHIAYTIVAGGSIAIALKIFETFFMVVQVTEKAELYGVRDGDAPALRFVEIAAAARVYRESSLAEEIARQRVLQE